MIYLALVALHVVAVVTFVGGTLVDAIALRALDAPGGDSLRATLAPVVRGWDRSVTTPAMLLVWTFGIVLALAGHRFGQLWLSLKLVAVVALSALHGMQSGRLRRLTVAAADRDRPSTIRPALAVLGLAAVAIALAFLKPAHA